MITILQHCLMGADNDNENESDAASEHNYQFTGNREDRTH
jgi:hypothetical protein